MKRRDFMAGAAAVGAAAVFGVSGEGVQQPPAQGERQGGPVPPQPGGGGRGRGRGPAPVPPAKLARVSLMTLDFNPYIRDPATRPGTGPDAHPVRPAEDVRRVVRYP